MRKKFQKPSEFAQLNAQFSKTVHFSPYTVMQKCTNCKNAHAKMIVYGGLYFLAKVFHHFSLRLHLLTLFIIKTVFNQSLFTSWKLHFLHGFWIKMIFRFAFFMFYFWIKLFQKIIEIFKNSLITKSILSIVNFGKLIIIEYLDIIHIIWF